MAAITLDEYVKNFREKLERWPAYDELWEAAIKIAEKKFTSTNSNYMAALRGISDYRSSEDDNGGSIDHLKVWLQSRLNSAKAPNCA